MIKDIIKHGKYQNLSMLVLTGSHCYGLATPESDMDYRGLIVLSKEVLLGLQDFNVYEQRAPNPDVAIWSIRHFFKIVSQTNIQALEILFAPDDKIIKIDSVGERVRQNRNLFLSKKGIYRSIKGYALAEWRKAKAVEQSLEFKEGPQHEALDLLTTRFHVERQDRDKIIDILQDYIKYDPRIEKDVSKDLGARRREAFNKFGYCPKNAAHTIRLMSQGIELLITRTMTFPRLEASILREIKSGKTDFKLIEEMYGQLQEQFEDAFVHSDLPERVDQSKINELYMDIVKDYIK